MRAAAYGMLALRTAANRSPHIDKTPAGSPQPL